MPRVSAPFDGAQNPLSAQRNHSRDDQKIAVPNTAKRAAYINDSGEPILPSGPPRRHTAAQSKSNTPKDMPASEHTTLMIMITFIAYPSAHPPGAYESEKGLAPTMTCRKPSQCLLRFTTHAYSTILVPNTVKNLASQSGCAGHAGAVTRLPSTWALSTGISMYVPPQLVTSGPTAG